MVRQNVVFFCFPCDDICLHSSDSVDLFFCSHTDINNHTSITMLNAWNMTRDPNVYTILVHENSWPIFTTGGKQMVWEVAMALPTWLCVSFSAKAGTGLVSVMAELLLLMSSGWQPSLWDGGGRRGGGAGGAKSDSSRVQDRNERSHK